MGTRLFVGGLSWGTTDESLRGAFEPYGVVEEARVVLDRETGRSRGFGFIRFGNDEEAALAIEKMNGASLEGRTIRVNEAEDRGGRGRGPRGGPPRGGPPRSGPPRRGAGSGPPGHSGPRPSPRPPTLDVEAARAMDIPRADGFGEELDARPRRRPPPKKRSKPRGDDEGRPSAKPPRKKDRRKSGRTWRELAVEDDDFDF